MTPTLERRVLKGIAASSGVAIGPATVLIQSANEVPRRRIRGENISAEVTRLRAAIDRSRSELERVRNELAGDAQAEHRLILDAHLLMHRDELLVDEAARMVHDESINAEWALRRTVDALKERLQSAGSAYFRERAADIEHVAKHIMRELVSPHVPLLIDGPTVLVASDLSPADVTELLRTPVQGIVTELGSGTSHTALFARTLEVPAVVGVPGACRRITPGDILIVDAFRGEVIVNPNDDEQHIAEQRHTRYITFTGQLRSRKNTTCCTRDGTDIALLANVELPSEAALAVNEGAQGIGLYRTEFLYLNRTTVPSEEEQVKVYTDVVRVMAPRPVAFRTYDLGADKLPRIDTFPRAANPALGLRALRLSLAQPSLFRVQVRAILQAAAHGAAQLMFPLVTTIEEVRAARAVVEDCCAELTAQGIEHRRVPIGVMIEVPSAALMADTFAAESDFFSVGTNDLVQYALAVDRSNPDVAHLAQPLEPAVLKLLAMTVRAASTHGLPLTMCGDMAANLIALPIVLGLGYRSVSIPVGGLALTREIVSRLDAALARQTALDAMECSNADAAVRLVFERFGDSLGDIWSEHGIDLTDGAG